MILVNEIFHSIQGEGPHVGKPAIFLRLAGCNLRCTWCDSKFTWNTPINRVNRTIKATNDRNKIETNNELIKKIKSYPCKHLVITGGEPLIQQDKLIPLLEELKDYFIEVETNGSIPLRITKYIEQINCSPKLSNSGNKEYELMIKPEEKVIYKFVINSTESENGDSRQWEDIKDIKHFIKKNNIPKSSVYLMPEGTNRTKIIESSKKLIEICKKEGYNFSPRLHVMIWGNKRGK